MVDDRVWFVAARFERLRDLLFEHGYALDPGPRDPSEWDERHYEDPPVGLVRLKGVRLDNPHDEQSELDPEITFSIQELWAPAHVEGAQAERGYFLIEYSYHAHHHGTDQRWDFDPAGHPEMPYHHHPPSRDSDRRRLAEPIDPREAIADFHRWVDRQVR